MSSSKRGQAGLTSNTLRTINYKQVNWRVVLTALLITGLVATSWTYLGSRTNQAQYIRKLELKETELTQKLDELNKTKLDTLQLQETKTKLEAEKADLETKLQAKAQAKVYAEALSALPVAVIGDCSTWLKSAGITDLTSASELIRKESGCNPNIVNRSSGACGVAQELPCGKSGCKLGDGECQVKWMDSYIKGRYGSWASALNFHKRMNWY